MAIYQLGDDTPVLDPSAYVVESAILIGQVRMAAQSSVWFNAVARADSATISIGENSNVQDGSVLHVDPGFPLDIGKNVTIGHQVMLHGCSIGDGSLIGIQAIILNGAKIGRNCLVGAGALVTEGMEFPDNSLILGAPAKLVRPLSEKQLLGIQRSSQHYVERARQYRHGLRRLG